MWADDPLKLVRLCMSHDVWHVYTQSSPTGKRDSLPAPGSSRNHNSTEQLIKHWTHWGSHLCVCTHTHTKLNEGMVNSRHIISNTKPQWPWAETFLRGHLNEGPNVWQNIRQMSAVNWIWLNSTAQLRGRGASCAMTVNQHYYNNTGSLGIFSPSHVLWKTPHMHMLTRRFEFPEVDVD